MQLFGWNLDSRQESFGTADVITGPYFTCFFDGKTTNESSIQFHQQVVLHFTRDANIHNLDRIRFLEKEFLGLRYPNKPELFPLSVWIWIMLLPIWGFGVIGLGIVLCLFIYTENKGVL